MQVALEAAREPLHKLHEVVHPLEENSLAPLTAMVQTTSPPAVTAIAAEIWAMTTGQATGHGPVADDFRDILRQGSLILAGTAAVVVPKIQAMALTVEEVLPEATLGAADAIGLYAVFKEGIAASKGKCKP